MLVPLSLLMTTGLLVVQCAAPVDWIDRSPNGGYELAYATGDEGGHFKTEVASPDNTVSGKFGFRDPASGGLLQTTYTAGRRGFRPRGPHIARKISLSQAGPIRPQDDGKYHPELDGADPSESQAYDFAFNTRDVVKEEQANDRGDVRGRYSYFDDLGVRRSVEYFAGAEKGFNVVNAVPDSFVKTQTTPLIFQGKRPVGNVRGLTAVQKNPDGSYRFAASGPDHKRSEVKDAFGNTRGSYSYIDDKGQTRTVEYIAGPNIGFQVINGRRPALSSLFPSIPDVTPTPTNLFGDFPSTPSGFFPDVTPTTSPFFGDFFPVTPSSSNPSTSLRPPSTNAADKSTETSFTSGLTSISTNFPSRPQSDNLPSSSPTLQSQAWPTAEPWLEDFGSLQEQLFPGGKAQPSPDIGSRHLVFPAVGRKPVHSPEYSGNCCKSSWKSGSGRGRAVRAHVQSIDVTQDRHMSPGEALQLHS